MSSLSTIVHTLTSINEAPNTFFISDIASVRAYLDGYRYGLYLIGIEQIKEDSYYRACCDNNLDLKPYHQDLTFLSPNILQYYRPDRNDNEARILLTNIEIRAWHYTLQQQQDTHSDKHPLRQNRTLMTIPDTQRILHLLRIVQSVPGSFLDTNFDVLPTFLAGYRTALSHVDMTISSQAYVAACRAYGINLNKIVNQLTWKELSHYRPMLDMFATADLILNIEVQAWEQALDIQEIHQASE